MPLAPITNDGPDAALRSADSARRKLVLNPGPNEQDYQSPSRTRGAIGYVIWPIALLSNSRHEHAIGSVHLAGGRTCCRCEGIL